MLSLGQVFIGRVLLQSLLQVLVQTSWLEVSIPLQGRSYVAKIKVIRVWNGDKIPVLASEKRTISLEQFDQQS